MLYFFIILYIYYTLFSILTIILYQKKKIRKRNILLVIAHPDDEIMFFFPTIKQLNNDNNIHIICLSNGNYNNLGIIREKEIKSYWNIEKIKINVENQIKKYNIDTIITFDEKGISYHPNHISCNMGVKNIKGIDIYILETVNFYRKFIAYFDIFNITLI